MESDQRNRVFDQIWDCNEYARKKPGFWPSVQIFEPQKEEVDSSVTSSITRSDRIYTLRPKKPGFFYEIFVKLFGI